VLDVIRVHTVAVQDVVLGVAEVVAHRANHADVAELGSSEREMHGGPAERAVTLAKRSLDRVKRDRTDHYQAHGLAQASRYT
jgi:hypothetical protein